MSYVMSEQARLREICRYMMGLGIAFYWIGQDPVTLGFLREAAQVLGEDLVRYGIGPAGELIPLPEQNLKQLEYIEKAAVVLRARVAQEQAENQANQENRKRRRS